MDCTPAVDEASTAGSLLLASMVEVESGLTSSSFETWLGRCVTGEVGGEMKITSGSVDTAGLQGAKDRKSASMFERTARMSSLESSLRWSLPWSPQDLALLIPIELYRTWPKTKKLAAIKMWTLSFVIQNLSMEPSKWVKRKIADFTTGLPSGKGLSIVSEEKLWKIAVISNRRSVGTKTE